MKAGLGPFRKRMLECVLFTTGMLQTSCVGCIAICHGKWPQIFQGRFHSGPNSSDLNFTEVYQEERGF